MGRTRSGGGQNLSGEPYPAFSLMYDVPCTPMWRDTLLWRDREDEMRTSFIAINQCMPISHTAWCAAGSIRHRRPATTPPPPHPPVLHKLPPSTSSESQHYSEIDYHHAGASIMPNKQENKINPGQNILRQPAPFNSTRAGYDIPTQRNGK